MLLAINILNAKEKK